MKKRNKRARQTKLCDQKLDVLLQCLNKRYDQTKTTELEHQTESSDDDDPMLARLPERKRKVSDPVHMDTSEKRTRDVVQACNGSTNSSSSQRQVSLLILLSK